MVRIALEKDITVAFVVEYLRKISDVRKDQSIFVENNKKIIDIGTNLEEMYAENADEDGFIYLRVKT